MENFSKYKMVNKDILEGLRTALQRGYTLEQAMMSFFNAGYKKEEIEDAARYLHEHSEDTKKIIESTPKQEHEVRKLERPLTEPLKKKSFFSRLFKREAKQKRPKTKQEEKQEVSKYEEKTKPKSKAITILLIIVLIALVSLLVAMVLFRNDLINIFKSLF